MTFRRSSSMLSGLSGLTRRGSVFRTSSVALAPVVEPRVDMKLGGEADAARPPSRRIIIIGTKSCGKSTLIRQLGILFSVQSGEQERLKYKKEVHKAALAAFQALLLGVAPTEAVKAILELRKRSPITAIVAESLAELCAGDSAKAALGAMQDMAARQTCTHFIGRLNVIGAPTFVPDPTDLLYLSVPTSGRQETRLRGTPGGPLSVVEMSIADFVEEMARGVEERDVGLAAVIFIASATEFDSGAEKSVEPDALAAWTTVRDIAAEASLPPCVMLSKCDLLSLRAPEGGAKAEGALLSQFERAASTAVNLLDGPSTRASFLELMRGPLQLEDNDDAAALEEGCYLALAFFAPGATEAGRVLLHHRAIPHTLIQPEPLNLEDQIWLQRLPQPIPNPTRATPDEAARLGKGSSSSIAANFWVGLCSLSRALGHTEPDHFGVLHPVPLLLPPGTAMLVLCCTFPTPDLKFSGMPRNICWRGLDDAAVAMAGAMPGDELFNFARNRKRSYSVEIEAQRKVSTGDLHPRVWLSKLKQANAMQAKPLEAGTHVCALYLTSTAQGLQILLPTSDTSLLPSVKVSNRLLDGLEWLRLRDLVTRLGGGDVTCVPPEWAKAKAWLGPDVTSEDVFSDVQKLFYGVVALRQALARHCSPMKDSLSYSLPEHARDSLTSLGSLLPQESAIVLDEAATTRAVVVVKFYAMECPDAFPEGFHWHPLELFEARSAARLVPDCFERYLRAKRNALERKMQAPGHLRTSGMSQCSQASSTTSSAQPTLHASQNDAVAIEEVNWNEAIEATWDRVRWLKDATLWAMSAERSRLVEPGAGAAAQQLNGATGGRRKQSRRTSVGLAGGSVVGRRRSTVNGKKVSCVAEQRLHTAMIELERILSAINK